MDHVAIDLGSKESQICVRASDGRLLEEGRRPTLGLGKYLSGRPASRVVLETCAEAFSVAEAARAAGHEVRIVPASLVRALGVGARGLKTDERDARALSQMSCRMEDLPSVHLPSKESRERKALCGMKEALTEARTKLVNSVRGWMRSQGLGGPRGGALVTFNRRIRERLKVKEVVAPSYVERQLAAIEQLSIQIVAGTKELEALAKADPTCRRLMTAPGVGPATSIRFLAAVDDVSRFPNARVLESYLGLVPGENSSSERRRLTSITKAGATKVRWVLVQAAWAAWRHRKLDPLVVWAQRVGERRGRRIAIVALSRRLAGVLYALLRDGSTYDAHHLARISS